MARATLSELITQINATIAENTSGNITATSLNQLLDYLTNNLYLPTDSTVTVNTTAGVKTFTFGTGFTVTVDTATGEASIDITDKWDLLNFDNLDARPRVKAVSNVSQSIPTYEGGHVVTFEVSKTLVGVGLSSGVITFNERGIYSLHAMFNMNLKDAASSGDIEAWIEKYNDASSSWEVVEDSGRNKEFITATLTNEAGSTQDITFKTDGTFDFFDNGLEIRKGDKLRILVRCTVTGVELSAKTLTNGVKAPSAILSIAKV